jgi:hypothetical protein
MSGKRRLVLAGGVLAIVAFAATAIAATGYPTDSVTVMTACLTTSGTSAGNMMNVAVGSAPAKACGSNQVLVHLSGGTITRVTAGAGITMAGSGGTGGAGYVNNGFTTVGLDSHYQLPQTGCGSGQVVASNGSGGWSCQDQKTYSGTDFALSNQSCDNGKFLTGFDTAGVEKCGAALPQGCTTGQIVASDGTSGWTCTDQSTSTPEGVGDLTDYTVSRFVPLGDDDTDVADVFCKSGDIATGGGWSVADDATIVQAGPVNDNGYEGWSAKAKTGVLEFGGLTVSVKCLTTLH